MNQYLYIIITYCCYLVTKLCLTLCDPCTVAHQPPLSVEFPSQEYWSWLPFPTPGDLPGSGIEPTSPALVDRFFVPVSHEGRSLLTIVHTLFVFP